MGEKIVDPLKRSILVSYDMSNFRIGPSHNQTIARHVERWSWFSAYRLGLCGVNLDSAVCKVSGVRSALLQ